MKGPVLLLSFAALCCGVFQLCQATSCTSATMSTCVKSLFVTGKCDTDVCQCATGYTPGPFGCQKKRTSAITATFNGQAKTGVNAAIFSCTEGLGSYKWYKDGVDASSTDKDFQKELTTGDSGSYTCQSDISGIMSEISAPFDLTVADTLDRKPTVLGMPTSVVTGMKYDLTCSNPPFDSPLTYEWHVGGTKEDGQITDTFKEFTGNAGKNVTCTAAGVMSDEVTVPVAVDEVTGVEITAVGSTKLMEGETLTLTCDLTWGFPKKPDGGVTYKWKKGADDLVSTTHTYTKASVASADTGTYWCEAKATTGTNAAFVQVAVENTMQKDKITQSAKYLLKKGHFTLTCDYKSVSTDVAVTFKWFKDDEELLGVTDKVLQFNEPGAADVGGSYKCQVVSEHGSVINDAVDVITKETTEIPNITPTMTDTAGGAYGVGNSYTFTCKTDYYTPGSSYEWYVGSTKQGNATDKFTYTFKNTDITVIKCKYVFDGETSQEQKKSIEATYIVSAVVKVNGQKAEAKPVTGSELKFVCDVVKSAGAGTVTYEWIKDSTPVDGETSKEYKMSATTATTIKCKATANTKSTESSALTVTPQSGVETPTVVITHPGYTDTLIGSRVLFSCVSASYAEGAVFEWTKWTTKISGATSFNYVIDGITHADTAIYKCKITVGGKSAEDTTGKTLVAKANEVTCFYAEDCTGENFDSTVCKSGKCKCQTGYTLKAGQCTKSNQVTCVSAKDCAGKNFVCVSGKCKCQTGYTLKAGQCSKSGATAVIGSLLVIVAAALTTFGLF